MVIAEPNAIPLRITTPSLQDAVSAHAYAGNLTRVGGDASAVWSKSAGGTNDGWITVNAATGAVTGTPTAANVGPVVLKVHIQEPSLPSNFDDKTFMFNVTTPIYFQDFEGTCPDGWTLTGAWQCGTPTPITGNGNAPPMAFSGSHCLATNLGMGYANNDALASNHATTPAIVLPAGGTPALDFHGWVETESGFDGFELEVSTDGGAN